jgi:lipid-A-disaccharide synthase-like uncharacterized protein
MALVFWWFNIRGVRIDESYKILVSDFVVGNHGPQRLWRCIDQWAIRHRKRQKVGQVVWNISISNGQLVSSMQIHRNRLVDQLFRNDCIAA